MAEYDISRSIHRGESFDVFDVGSTALVIVRKPDGVERSLQGDDADSLETDLDLFGAVFDVNAEYVEHADRHLSEFFSDDVPDCTAPGSIGCKIRVKHGH